MAVTVTYTYPVAGTVPPTAIQASRVPTVTGYIDWDNAGVVSTILFTHNMGVATAPGFVGRMPAISQGFPEITLLIKSTDVSAPNAIYSGGAESINGNVVQVVRNDNGQAFRQYVTVRAPHSMGL